ncbi:MAG: transcription-repair coupling factor [Deltaproteobacteria bacterium]|nr:transcription-repair coupling factor [Deltaproteobacteria bacterium]
MTDTIVNLQNLWDRILAPEGDRVDLAGLAGSSRAYLLARLEEFRPHPLLVITSSPSEAERFFNDLSFFLRGASLGETVVLFPQWEVLPYDDRSPHPEIVRQRLTALNRLAGNENLITITTVRAAIQKVLPKEALSRGSFTLHVGESLEPDLLTEELIHFGYRQTDLVECPGTFCRRGGILDLFPPNLDTPLRLDYFGDEIESIRRFSPENQRSTDPVDSCTILLSREILLDPASMASLHPDGEMQRCPALSQIEEGIIPEGIEFYAPLFTPRMATLFDYLPENTGVVIDQPAKVEEQAEKFHHEIAERHDIVREQGKAPCAAEELYLDAKDFQAVLETKHRVWFVLSGGEEPQELFFKTESIGGLARPGKSRITALSETLQTLRNETDLSIVVRTKGQAERLMEILTEEEGIPCRRIDHLPEVPRPKGAVGILIAPLSSGFRFPLFGLTLITEEEIFGIKRSRRPPRQVKEGPFVTRLSDLAEGNFVVHIDHGIGIYRGLREVEVEGSARDLIRIEYAGKDLLYLPPEKLHLMQKYSGSDEHAVQISKLGGTGWEKLKGKIKKSIEEMSRELIELYAERKVAQGTAFSPPDSLFREFEETFEYDETPDQARAIEEVLQDMQKPTPMDRLVCGDVGYGKTEVAIRAAFKAALDGKQTAILVPTTLLARQHAENFARRFRPFPVEVAMLSRFANRSEQKVTLEKIKKGETDILIGTHRLLSRDIAFKNLGLLIIDEEQRFGVRHKEKLKQLRKEVDVLTLTATPIPRTLEMSLLGIRDISIINTPPEDRLSIDTRVVRFSEGIIREACLRELDRGGQIFFVHNRVRDIDRMAERMRRIVPEARVDVAHGQMEQHHLQEVMNRFLDRETDLLVTTTIIESGLDIPNANTMLIHQPEMFGLGQLYQLRGRIGRTRHRAYAYLLTRADRSMTEVARQRLQVIQELTELGSGFQLAARDLEIRGAGNLLGAKQSGFISAVGIDLYMQLIEEVSLKLKGEKREETIEPSLRIRVSARIPKAYIREDRLRLDLYRRLALLDSNEELYRIADEMKDRFGTPPKEVHNLLRLAELRILCRKLRVLEILEQKKGIRLSFDRETPVSRERIITLLQSAPHLIHPLSEYQLEFMKEGESFGETWVRMKNFLQELI